MSCTEREGKKKKKENQVNLYLLFEHKHLTAVPTAPTNHKSNKQHETGVRTTCFSEDVSVISM